MDFIKYHMRFLVGPCIIFLLFSAHASWGQKAAEFFEIIEGDSAAFFFSNQGAFTEKRCADYIRYIRISKDGNFNGYFEDFNTDTQRLRAKGVYVQGIKHGYFEFYFSTGKIQRKGYYVNNHPVGIWEYFYDSDIPERIIQITDSAVLLLHFVDPKGVVKVQDGNGVLYSPVRAILYGELNDRVFGSPEKKIPIVLIAKVRGSVVNGKPHGKWKGLRLLDNTSVYMEKFDHGKLVKTSVISKKKMTDDTQSYLYNRFLNNYTHPLEEFYFIECKEDELYTTDPWLNHQILRDEIRQRIDEKIEGDIHKRDTEHYRYGDNLMVVQFSVNGKGKAQNIQLVSEWGGHFFDIVKNSIQQAVFSSKNGIMHYRMRLSYAGGRRYRYTFKFSKHKG